jgi:hypothetical protein
VKIALLMLLVGCNSVFGNNPVQRIDAQYFDAPIDAPSQCPPIGQTPQFTSVLHQVFVQDCAEYTFNGGRAIAPCRAPDGGFSIFEGALDQPLALVSDLYEPTAPAVYDTTRLSSDARTLYARHVDFDTNAVELRAATRQPDGSWQLVEPPPFGQNPGDLPAGFAAGATGDHAFIHTSGNVVHEWVFDGAGWSDVRVHDFGAPIVAANVTADGLRITLAMADKRHLFSDRPDEDSLFRDPVLLPNSPSDAQARMMSVDCGRLYVSGLQSVFYAEQ